MTKRLLITLCACMIASTGCNIIYKQNIQQGNALKQEDLDQLELGMSQNQVAFLLGTPSIHDPFHHDRWDYVSTFSRRGGEPVMRQVNLRFEAGKLIEMLGVDQRDSGEQVLTAEGAVAVTSAIAPVGINVEGARNYEDLSLVPEESEVWTVQAGSFSTRGEAEPFEIGQVRMHSGRAGLERIENIDHHRQVLVFNFNQINCFLSSHLIVGGHCGDGFPDIEDLITGHDVTIFQSTGTEVDIGIVLTGNNGSNSR